MIPPIPIPIFRLLLAVIASASLLRGFARESEASIPDAYPASRYQPIWENSPFQLETPVSALPSPGALSQQFSLVGVTKVGGIPVATLQKRREKTTFNIKKGEANEHGIELLAVNMAADFKDTQVRLRQGSLTGSLGFDTNRLAAPARPPLFSKGAAKQAAGQRSGPPAQPAAANATKATTQRVPRRRIILPKR